jgi:hypothetical protein
MPSRSHHLAAGRRVRMPPSLRIAPAGHGGCLFSCLPVFSYHPVFARRRRGGFCGLLVIDLSFVSRRRGVLLGACRRADAEYAHKGSQPL